MKERVCIFIDAGNFYHLSLKKIGLEQLDFDFDSFAEHLAGKRSICKMGKRYYTGTVREKEGDEYSKKMMAKQTRLFANLKDTCWELKTSKLRTRLETLKIDSRVKDAKKFNQAGIQEVVYERQREKGIDVKLATDLIAGAIDKKYDTAIIVSSDTDLVPAIDWVRSRELCKIEYVGFSIPDPSGEESKKTIPSLGLIKRSDHSKTLTVDDIENFVVQNLLNS